MAFCGNVVSQCVPSSLNVSQDTHDEVQPVGLIPEIGVEGDDLQALGGKSGIGSVVALGDVGDLLADPSLMLPKRRQVIVVVALRVG